MSSLALSNAGQLRNDFAVSSDYFFKFTTAPRAQVIIEKATVAAIEPSMTAEEERGQAPSKRSLLSPECENWLGWVGL